MKPTPAIGEPMEPRSPLLRAIERRDTRIALFGSPVRLILAAVAYAAIIAAAIHTGIDIGEKAIAEEAGRDIIPE